MNILVKVSEDRKCSASIDSKGCYQNDSIWILSFGDLDKPDTDVEVKFTIKQLKELKETIDKAIEQFNEFQKESEERELERKKISAEKRESDYRMGYVDSEGKKAHFGSC